MVKNNNNFEAALFKTADKLRKNIGAAEYKITVLGLIFLKYISDSFQELYERLKLAFILAPGRHIMSASPMKSMMVSRLKTK